MPKAPPPPNPRKIFMQVVRKNDPIRLPAYKAPHALEDTTAPMDGVYFTVGSANMPVQHYLFIEAIRLWEELDKLI